MLRKKNFLVVTIIILLVFLVTGCSGVLPKPTKGVISGRVLIPPTAKQLSKDISGWVGAAGAEVTIVDANGVKHTVITDENGYYNFENIAVKANTVVTATVKVDGKTMVLKTVIEKTVGKEQKHDSGAMTPESTALAIVVEHIQDLGGIVNLDEIKETDSYLDLLGKVTEVLEAQGNVEDDAGVQDLADEAVDEILYPDDGTPTPPSGGGPVVPANPATISMMEPDGEVPGTEGWTRFAGKVKVKSWVKEGDIKAYYIFEITEGELENNSVPEYYHYINETGGNWLSFDDEGEGKYRFGPSNGFNLKEVHGAETQFQVKIDGEKCTGITGKAYLVDAETESIISNVVEKTISLPVINTDQNKGYFYIQEAIDEAAEGDTILVGAGEYDIGETKILVDKGINLIGAGYDNTIIKGTVHRAGTPANDIVQPMLLTISTTGNTVIEGITFEWVNDSDIDNNYYSAISLAGDHVTVKDCKISTNVPDTNHITVVNIGRSGGSVPEEAGVAAQNISFIDNIVEGTISIVPSVLETPLHAVITGNTITAVNMEGIWTYCLNETGDELVIENNQISGVPSEMHDIKLMEKVKSVNGNGDYTADEISQANNGASVLLQYISGDGSST